MYFPDLFFVERGIEKMGHIILAAVTANEINLVFHQGDQWAYDDDKPIGHERR